MNGHPFFGVQHPAFQIVRARESVNERPKADALDNAAHRDGVSVQHELYLAFTTQPRPCQPTWMTLPSSTKSGTVKGACASERMRWRARTSASTSYSVNSLPFHSSQ